MGLSFKFLRIMQYVFRNCVIVDEKRDEEMWKYWCFEYLQMEMGW